MYDFLVPLVNLHNVTITLVPWLLLTPSIPFSRTSFDGKKETKYQYPLAGLHFHAPRTWLPNSRLLTCYTRCLLMIHHNSSAPLLIVGSVYLQVIQHQWKLHKHHLQSNHLLVHHHHLQEQLIPCRLTRLIFLAIITCHHHGRIVLLILHWLTMTVSFFYLYM